MFWEKVKNIWMCTWFLIYWNPNKNQKKFTITHINLEYENHNVEGTQEKFHTVRWEKSYVHIVRIFWCMVVKFFRGIEKKTD